MYRVGLVLLFPCLLGGALAIGLPSLSASQSRRVPFPASHVAKPLSLPDRDPPHRYQIDAVVDADGRIEGRVRITAQNRASKPLDKIALHLYLQAFSSDDTLFMKSSGGRHRGHRANPKARGWMRVGDVRVDKKPVAAHEQGADPSVWTVVPSKPIPASASYTMTTRFSAQLPAIFARTGKARELLMLAQWFPKLGVQRADGSWHCPPFHGNAEFFADFANYDVAVSLPQGHVVGATGREIARSRDPKRHGFRRYHFTGRWVHDFALVAWPHFEHSRFFVEHVQVTLLSVPGRGNQRARQRFLIERGLVLLGRWLGRYPYRRLTVVDLPLFAKGAAAMEYPQLFTVNTPLWTPSGVHIGDEITLHELTHQYFQGIVASNEVEHPWLDEGVTTFVSGLLGDAIFGKQRSTVDFLGVKLGQRDKNHLHQLMKRPPLAVGLPARKYKSFWRYGTAVYGRAASLLYTIDSLIGRKAMLAALGRYVSSHAFSHPGPEALKRAITSTAPAPLAKTVGELLERVLSSDAQVDYAVHCDPDRLRVERRGISVPLTVHWQDAHGAHERALGNEKQRWRIEAPGLVSAQLAPRVRLTLDQTPLDHACDRSIHPFWQLVPAVSLLLGVFLP
jgi:hypothetical protein